MNERIKQLMKQADYPAPEIALRAQKLVEIVVLECARIASSSPYPYNDIELILDGRQTWDLARSEAGDEIQKYFGVE